MATFSHSNDLVDALAEERARNRTEGRSEIRALTLLLCPKCQFCEFPGCSTHDSILNAPKTNKATRCYACNIKNLDSASGASTDMSAPWNKACITCHDARAMPRLVLTDFDTVQGIVHGLARSTLGPTKREPEMLPDSCSAQLLVCRDCTMCMPILTPSGKFALPGMRIAPASAITLDSSSNTNHTNHEAHDDDDDDEDDGHHASEAEANADNDDEDEDGEAVKTARKGKKGSLKGKKSKHNSSSSRGSHKAKKAPSASASHYLTFTDCVDATKKAMKHPLLCPSRADQFEVIPVKFTTSEVTYLTSAYRTTLTAMSDAILKLRKPKDGANALIHATGGGEHDVIADDDSDSTGKDKGKEDSYKSLWVTHPDVDSQRLTAASVSPATLAADAAPVTAYNTDAPLLPGSEIAVKLDETNAFSAPSAGESAPDSRYTLAGPLTRHPYPLWTARAFVGHFGDPYLKDTELEGGRTSESIEFMLHYLRKVADAHKHTLGDAAVAAAGKVAKLLMDSLDTARGLSTTANLSANVKPENTVETLRRYGLPARVAAAASVPRDNELSRKVSADDIAALNAVVWDARRLNDASMASASSTETESQSIDAVLVNMYFTHQSTASDSNVPLTHRMLYQTVLGHMDKLAVLPPGGVYVFPGGYRGPSGGHAVMHAVIRGRDDNVPAGAALKDGTVSAGTGTKADSFDLIVCNTGDGLSFHPCKPNERKIKYVTALCLNNIPRKRMLVDTFWSVYFTSITQVAQPFSARRLYEAFLPVLTGARVSKSFTLEPAQLHGVYRTQQRAGTCFHRCVIDMTRYLLALHGVSHLKWKDFSYLFRLEILRDTLADLTVSPTIADAAAVPLMRLAARQTARAALKTPRSAGELEEVRVLVLGLERALAALPVPATSQGGSNYLSAAAAEIAFEAAKKDALVHLPQLASTLSDAVTLSRTGSSVAAVGGAKAGKRVVSSAVGGVAGAISFTLPPNDLAGGGKKKKKGKKGGKAAKKDTTESDANNTSSDDIAASLAISSAFGGDNTSAAVKSSRPRAAVPGITFDLPPVDNESESGFDSDDDDDDDDDEADEIVAANDDDDACVYDFDASLSLTVPDSSNTLGPSVLLRGQSLQRTGSYDAVTPASDPELHAAFMAASGAYDSLSASDISNIISDDKNSANIASLVEADRASATALLRAHGPSEGDLTDLLLPPRSLSELPAPSQKLVYLPPQLGAKATVSGAWALHRGFDAFARSHAKVVAALAGGEKKGQVHEAPNTVTSMVVTAGDRESATNDGANTVSAAATTAVSTGRDGNIAAKLNARYKDALAELERLSITLNRFIEVNTVAARIQAVQYASYIITTRLPLPKTLRERGLDVLPSNDSSAKSGDSSSSSSSSKSLCGDNAVSAADAAAPVRERKHVCAWQDVTRTRSEVIDALNVLTGVAGKIFLALNSVGHAHSQGSSEAESTNAVMLAALFAMGDAAMRVQTTKVGGHLADSAAAAADALDSPWRLILEGLHSGCTGIASIPLTLDNGLCADTLTANLPLLTPETAITRACVLAYLKERDARATVPLFPTTGIEQTTEVYRLYGRIIGAPTKVGGQSMSALKAARERMVCEVKDAATCESTGVEMVNYRDLSFFARAALLSTQARCALISQKMWPLLSSNLVPSWRWFSINESDSNLIVISCSIFSVTVPFSLSAQGDGPRASRASPNYYLTPLAPRESVLKDAITAAENPDGSGVTHLDGTPLVLTSTLLLGPAKGHAIKAHGGYAKRFSDETGAVLRGPTPHRTQELPFSRSRMPGEAEADPELALVLDEMEASALPPLSTLPETFTIGALTQSSGSSSSSPGAGAPVMDRNRGFITKADFDSALWVDLPERHVLTASSLPTFAHLLNADSSRMVISALAEPYLRIPLLLARFVDGAKSSWLHSHPLRELLHAVLFEPGRFQSPHAFSLALTHAPAHPFRLGTPHGLLLNELFNAPEATLLPLCAIFDAVAAPLPAANALLSVATAKNVSGSAAKGCGLTLSGVISDAWNGATASASATSSGNAASVVGITSGTLSVTDAGLVLPTVSTVAAFMFAVRTIARIVQFAKWAQKQQQDKSDVLAGLTSALQTRLVGVAVPILLRWRESVLASATRRSQISSARSSAASAAATTAAESRSGGSKTGAAGDVSAEDSAAAAASAAAAGTVTATPAAQLTVSERHLVTALHCHIALALAALPSSSDAVTSAEETAAAVSDNAFTGDSLFSVHPRGMTAPQLALFLGSVAFASVWGRDKDIQADDNLATAVSKAFAEAGSGDGAGVGEENDNGEEEEDEDDEESKQTASDASNAASAAAALVAAQAAEELALASQQQALASPMSPGFSSSTNGIPANSSANGAAATGKAKTASISASSAALMGAGTVKWESIVPQCVADAWTALTQLRSAVYATLSSSLKGDAAASVKASVVLNAAVAIARGEDPLLITRNSGGNSANADGSSYDDAAAVKCEWVINSRDSATETAAASGDSSNDNDNSSADPAAFTHSASGLSFSLTTTLVSTGNHSVTPVSPSIMAHRHVTTVLGSHMLMVMQKSATTAVTVSTVFGQGATIEHWEPFSVALASVALNGGSDDAEDGDESKKPKRIPRLAMQPAPIYKPVVDGKSAGTAADTDAGTVVGYEYNSVRYTRAYGTEPLAEHEAWVALLLEPFFADLFDRRQNLSYTCLLPERPLTARAGTVTLLSCDESGTGDGAVSGAPVWRLMVVNRSRGNIELFTLADHARVMYPVPIFTTHGAHSLSSFEIALAGPAASVNYAFGGSSTDLTSALGYQLTGTELSANAKGIINLATPSAATVVIRSAAPRPAAPALQRSVLFAPVGEQVVVPSYLLNGILPRALLTGFTYWLSLRDHTLRGHPNASASAGAAGSGSDGSGSGSDSGDGRFAVLVKPVKLPRHCGDVYDGKHPTLQPHCAESATERALEALAALGRYGGLIYRTPLPADVISDVRSAADAAALATAPDSPVRLLVNPASTVQGSPLGRLADVLARVDDLSHVFVWGIPPAELDITSLVYGHSAGVDADAPLAKLFASHTAPDARPDLPLAADADADSSGDSENDRENDINGDAIVVILLSSRIIIDTIWLPRLNITLVAKTDRANRTRFHIREYSDYYISDVRSPALAVLCMGIPHGILLQTAHNSFAILVPTHRVVRMLPRSRPLNTDLGQLRGCWAWERMVAAGGARFYLYPVHPAQTHLTLPTGLGAGPLLYLLLLRLLHRVYGEAFELAKALTSTDTALSTEETYMLQQIECSMGDQHPDALAVRLKVVVSLKHTNTHHGWTLRFAHGHSHYDTTWYSTLKELGDYSSKAHIASARCTLSVDDISWLGDYNNTHFIPGVPATEPPGAADQFLGLTARSHKPLDGNLHLGVRGDVRHAPTRAHLDGWVYDYVPESELKAKGFATVNRCKSSDKSAAKFSGRIVRRRLNLGQSPFIRLQNVTIDDVCTQSNNGRHWIPLTTPLVVPTADAAREHTLPMQVSTPLAMEQYLGLRASSEDISSRLPRCLPLRTDKNCNAIADDYIEDDIGDLFDMLDCMVCDDDDVDAFLEECLTKNHNKSRNHRGHMQNCKANQHNYFTGDSNAVPAGLQPYLSTGLSSVESNISSVLYYPARSLGELETPLLSHVSYTGRSVERAHFSRFALPPAAFASYSFLDLYGETDHQTDADFAGSPDDACASDWLSHRGAIAAPLPVRLRRDRTRATIKIRLPTERYCTLDVVHHSVYKISRTTAPVDAASEKAERARIAAQARDDEYQEEKRARRKARVARKLKLLAVKRAASHGAGVTANDTESSADGEESKTIKSKDDDPNCVDVLTESDFESDSEDGDSYDEDGGDDGDDGAGGTDAGGGDGEEETSDETRAKIASMGSWQATLIYSRPVAASLIGPKAMELVYKACNDNLAGHTMMMGLMSLIELLQGTFSLGIKREDVAKASGRVNGKSKPNLTAAAAKLPSATAPTVVGAPDAVADADADSDAEADGAGDESAHSRSENESLAHDDDDNDGGDDSESANGSDGEASVAEDDKATAAAATVKGKSKGKAPAGGKKKAARKGAKSATKAKSSKAGSKGGKKGVKKPAKKAAAGAKSGKGAAAITSEAKYLSTRTSRGVTMSRESVTFAELMLRMAAPIEENDDFEDTIAPLTLLSVAIAQAWESVSDAEAAQERAKAVAEIMAANPKLSHKEAEDRYSVDRAVAEEAAAKAKLDKSKDSKDSDSKDSDSKTGSSAADAFLASIALPTLNTSAESVAAKTRAALMELPFVFGERPLRYKKVSAALLHGLSLKSNRNGGDADDQEDSPIQLFRRRLKTALRRARTITRKLKNWELQAFDNKMLQYGMCSFRKFKELPQDRLRNVQFIATGAAEMPLCLAGSAEEVELLLSQPLFEADLSTHLAIPLLYSGGAATATAGADASNLSGLSAESLAELSALGMLENHPTVATSAPARAMLCRIKQDLLMVNSTAASAASAPTLPEVSSLLAAAHAALAAGDGDGAAVEAGLGAQALARLSALTVSLRGLLRKDVAFADQAQRLSLWAANAVPLRMLPNANSSGSSTARAHASANASASAAAAFGYLAGAPAVLQSPLSPPALLPSPTLLRGASVVKSSAAAVALSASDIVRALTLTRQLSAGAQTPKAAAGDGGAHPGDAAAGVTATDEAGNSIAAQIARGAGLAERAAGLGVLPSPQQLFAQAVHFVQSLSAGENANCADSCSVLSLGAGVSGREAVDRAFEHFGREMRVIGPDYVENNEKVYRNNAARAIASVLFPHVKKAYANAVATVGMSNAAANLAKISDVAASEAEAGAVLSASFDEEEQKQNDDNSGDGTKAAPAASETKTTAAATAKSESDAVLNKLAATVTETMGTQKWFTTHARSTRAPAPALLPSAAYRLPLAAVKDSAQSETTVVPQQQWSPRELLTQAMHLPAPALPPFRVTSVTAIRAMSYLPALESARFLQNPNTANSTPDANFAAPTENQFPLPRTHANHDALHLLLTADATAAFAAATAPAVGDAVKHDVPPPEAQFTANQIRGLLSTAVLIDNAKRAARSALLAAVAAKDTAAAVAAARQLAAATRARAAHRAQVAVLLRALKARATVLVRARVAARDARVWRCVEAFAPVVAAFHVRAIAEGAEAHRRAFVLGRYVEELPFITQDKVLQSSMSLTAARPGADSLVLLNPFTAHCDSSLPLSPEYARTAAAMHVLRVSRISLAHKALNATRGLAKAILDAGLAQLSASAAKANACIGRNSSSSNMPLLQSRLTTVSTSAGSYRSGGGGASAAAAALGVSAADLLTLSHRLSSLCTLLMTGRFHANTVPDAPQRTVCFDPRFLAFEHAAGIVLHKGQVGLVRALLGADENVPLPTLATRITDADASAERNASKPNVTATAATKYVSLGAPKLAARPNAAARYAARFVGVAAKAAGVPLSVADINNLTSASPLIAALGGDCVRVADVPCFANPEDAADQCAFAGVSPSFTANLGLYGNMVEGQARALAGSRPRLPAPVAMIPTAVVSLENAPPQGASRVHQMIMGAGKTTVVGPLLMLIVTGPQQAYREPNSDARIEQHNVAYCVTPSALVPMTLSVLRGCLSSSFNIPVFLMDFQRDMGGFCGTGSSGEPSILKPLSRIEARLDAVSPGLSHDFIDGLETAFSGDDSMRTTVSDFSRVFRALDKANDTSRASDTQMGGNGGVHYNNRGGDEQAGDGKYAVTTMYLDVMDVFANYLNDKPMLTSRRSVGQTHAHVDSLVHMSTPYAALCGKVESAAIQGGVMVASDTAVKSMLLKAVELTGLMAEAVMDMVARLNISHMDRSTPSSSGVTADYSHKERDADGSGSGKNNAAKAGDDVTGGDFVNRPIGAPGSLARFAGEQRYTLRDALKALANAVKDAPVRGGRTPIAAPQLFARVCERDNANRAQTSEQNKEAITISADASWLLMRRFPASALKLQSLANAHVQLCTAITQLRESTLVLDEVDVLTHPLKSELNFPMGPKTALEPAPLRWLVPIVIYAGLLTVTTGAPDAETGRWRVDCPAAAALSQSAAGQKALQAMARVMAQAVAAGAVVLQPHVTVVDGNVYHDKVKETVARWITLFLLLRGVAAVAVDDDDDESKENTDAACANTANASTEELVFKYLTAESVSVMPDDVDADTAAIFTANTATAENTVMHRGRSAFVGDMVQKRFAPDHIALLNLTRDWLQVRKI